MCNSHRPLSVVRTEWSARCRAWWWSCVAWPCCGRSCGWARCPSIMRTFSGVWTSWRRRSARSTPTRAAASGQERHHTGEAPHHSQTCEWSLVWVVVEAWVSWELSVFQVFTAQAVEHGPSMLSDYIFSNTLPQLNYKKLSPLDQNYFRIIF